jgi:hypothetical protein
LHIDDDADPRSSEQVGSSPIGRVEWPTVKTKTPCGLLCFRMRMVQAMAFQSGLSANRLELEIAEAVLIRDGEAALAILHQLRAVGCE